MTDELGRRLFEQAELEKRDREIARLQVVEEDNKRLRAAIEAIITNTTRDDSSAKLLLIGCRSIALKALSE